MSEAECRGEATTVRQSSLCEMKCSAVATRDGSITDQNEIHQESSHQLTDDKGHQVLRYQSTAFMGALHAEIGDKSAEEEVSSLQTRSSEDPSCFGIVGSYRWPPPQLR